MSLINTILRPFGILYYLLTAYIPRKLPATQEEYDALKSILVDCYGVPNEPTTWIVVSGQINSTPAHKLRKSYGNIVNTVKRLEINMLAQRDKNNQLMALNEKLKSAVERESERMKNENEKEAQSEPEIQHQPSQELSENQH